LLADADGKPLTGDSRYVLHFSKCGMAWAECCAFSNDRSASLATDTPEDPSRPLPPGAKAPKFGH
jgi:hypothetical protein